MTDKKMLFKKPNEDLQKILTSTDKGNLTRAVKGNTKLIKLNDEKNYHAIVNENLLQARDGDTYNLTLKADGDVFSPDRYYDVYGNVIVFKMNDTGDMADLTNFDIEKLVKNYFYKRTSSEQELESIF